MNHATPIGPHDQDPWLMFKCFWCGFEPQMGIRAPTGGTFTNVSFTCPRCGAQNEDRRTYEFRRVAGLLEVIARETTVEELAEIQALLGRLEGKPDLTTEDVAEAVEKSPKMKGLAAWVRDNGGWLGAIGAAAAVMQLITQLMATPGMSPEDVQRVVSGVVQQTQQKPVTPAPSRNQPCFCGSGRKYKRCHGASAGAAGPDDGVEENAHAGSGEIGYPPPGP